MKASLDYFKLCRALASSRAVLPKLLAAKTAECITHYQYFSCVYWPIANGEPYFHFYDFSHRN